MIVSRSWRHPNAAARSSAISVKRARNQHVLLDAVIDQRRITLERRHVDRLGGQEQHDQFGRRGQRVPVALGAELGDVILHLPHVIGELPAANAIVGGALRIEKRFERRLRVDDDRAAAREG